MSLSFQFALPRRVAAAVLAQAIWLPVCVHAQTSMPPADSAALHDALDAYDRGDRVTAEPALRQLTAHYPKNFEAAEALGSLYIEAGDVHRSLPYLERAATLAPNQPIAHANLGAAYLKLSRITDATRELEHAAKLDPRNAATQSNLGQALMSANRPAAAAQAFTAAAALDPNNPDLAYNRALAFFDSNQPAAAAAALHAIPTPSMSAEANSLAGDIEEKLGRYKEAAEHMQAAAQLNPTSANLYALIVELLRHWTWPAAYDMASFAATKYPGETRFRAAAAIALYADNKYPQAVTAFAALLAADPANATYADLLGRSCGAIAEGVSTECSGLEAFATQHPENARIAAFAAASILHRPTADQDTAKADQLLHQAIAADPKLPEAWFELGELDQQRSQWKESADALEQAIALRPAYAQAHYRLSRAYAHLGRRDEAQQQMALQQQYSKQEEERLNSRMAEVVKFVLNPT